MSKDRLLIEKNGRGIYISHLDLMRTMQRAFIRAGIAIRHTEGFNPHPYLSFALPLSVGVESRCELLDYDLLSDLGADELIQRMNKALPEGVRVISAYKSDRKFRDLKYLSIEGHMYYDRPIPENTAEEIQAFLTSSPIVVTKKTKRGMADTDISPAISSLTAAPAENGVLISAVISAQEPTLNPDLLLEALRVHRPELLPDFTKFKRLEIFDANMQSFR